MLKKYFLSWLVTIFSSLFFVSCQNVIGGYSSIYEHPVYNSSYTEDEHAARITKRTEEVFDEEIASGALVKYNVDIVYAFDEDPEYFLVELEYAEEWENDCDGQTYTTKYRHTIGYIKDDEYYLGVVAMYGAKKSNDVKSLTRQAFMDGRSAYTLYGNLGERKYCGTAASECCQAVKHDGEMIMVVSARCANYCTRYDGTNTCFEFHYHVTDESYVCERGGMPDYYWKGNVIQSYMLGAEFVYGE